MGVITIARGGASYWCARPIAVHLLKTFDRHGRVRVSDKTNTLHGPELAEDHISNL
jgi:hypothetical protein